VIVFTMAFKCVLKILETYVNFTGLQNENYFCSRKMFSCRKLTGVETLLLVSTLFQLNENTNMCTVNSEHSDCISHSNTHTHTHTHTLYIYIYIYIYIQRVPKTLIHILRKEKSVFKRCCRHFL